MMPDLLPSPVAFVSTFLLGLGLNLTPCVYPMLSVTLSLFRGQGHETRKGAFLKALSYVLGISTMYSALGVIAAYTGDFFGAWLQNPWVLVGLGVLMIILALSLFGIYTFRMPSWLIPSPKGGERLNLAGFFFSGLGVSLIAAPCLGPPVLALLTWVGTQGDVALGFWLFFTLSLGLGFPYLILGTFSGLLRRLPRSGSWLVWVERFFGTVLLGFAGFYILAALNPSLIRWLIPGVFISGGVYLGWIEKSQEYSSKFLIIKKILGTLIVLGGLGLILAGPRQQVVWESYRPEILEEARLAHQPVIIDFYADWCISCHELDQWTYSDPQVIEVLKDFRRLKADLTASDTPEANAIINQFDLRGVPTIVFLNREGREAEEFRITGFMSPKEFVTWVRDLEADERAQA